VVDRAEDEYGEASEDASEQDAFHLATSFSEEDSSKRAGPGRGVCKASGQRRL
jgi:hypothetical protein